MLAPQLPDRKLTVDEFLDRYSGEEARWELVRGVPVMMASASRAHNRVVRNLIRRLANALDGSACEAMPSDMGLQTVDDGYRLPDVAIYCDPRDLASDGDPNRLSFPKVLFEVASPGTSRSDRMEKLVEYQALDSVDAVVFVHPQRRTLTVFERMADGAFRNVTSLPGAPLVLRDPALTIPADEIFEAV